MYDEKEPSDDDDDDDADADADAVADADADAAGGGGHGGDVDGTVVIQSTAARRNWIELMSTEASCELRVLCWAVAKEASMRFLAMPSVL